MTFLQPKWQCFTEKLKKKEKVKKRLQTNQEFKQKKIFDLNKRYNVDMFSTAVRGGKAFAAEQKLRELKKGIFRLKVLEKRINPFWLDDRFIGPASHCCC